MSHSGGGRGHPAQRPRPSVVPCLSSRTLQHPSFLPLYVAAGFAHSHTASNNQTVQHIIPAEVFYTDPTMSRGRRIPNVLSDLGVLECFQLNTPPPVMSAWLAAPNRPDPFRSGPHPTRNLGCPTWTTTRAQPQVQPSRAVVQLTQEEDQAVTNLLKLHHQEPRRGDGETLTAAAAARDLSVQNPCIFNTSKSMFSTSAEELHKDPRKGGSGNRVQQGRGWSHVELEAADTLLSGFRIWDQCCQKSAEMLPDPPPDQQDKDLPISTENQQEPETEPSSNASPSDNDTGHIRLSCVSENGGQVHGDSRSVEEDEGSAYGDFPEVRERALSDLEGDAVHVLLSLGDVGPLDVLQ